MYFAQTERNYSIISRGLALLLLLALGTGCSRTDFAYRNADWFIERYARQAVALDNEQEEAWQPVVQATLQRHREELLPIVIDYLERLEQALQDGEDSTVLQCLVDRAIFLYDQHARLAVDLAVPLLAGLDAGQVEHLDAYLAERDAELRERYRKADPAEQHASRVERISDRIEHWTGRLTDSQQQAVDTAIDRMPDLTGQWLAYRAQQGDRLLDLLRDDAGEAAVREHLLNWWVRRTGQPTEAGRRWEVAMAEFIDLLHTLDISLTDRQRRAFRDRLAGLREDLAPFEAMPKQAKGQQAMFTCSASPA